MTNERAHILHVINSLGVGGAENHLFDLISGLLDSGYEITVLYLTSEDPYADEDLVSELVESGANVEHIQISGNVDPIGLFQMWRHLRSRDYDLVHTHQIQGDIYGSVSATMAGITSIVSSKHNDPPFLTHQPYKLLHNLTIWLSDKIITISENVRCFTRQHSIASSDQLETIYYGLDPAPFDAVSTNEIKDVRSEFVESDEVLLGTVARLTEQKDLETLLEAFAEVLETHPKTGLAIVGDGPKRDELEKLAREYDISENVSFTGYRSDIPQLMHAFDTFVLPSRWEGFGRVFLEAMAASTPIVASNVSAIPEIVIDEETGLLADVGETQEFTSAINNLLESDDLRTELGKNGRNRLEEQFTVEKMVHETTEVYDEILNT